MPRTDRPLPHPRDDRARRVETPLRQSVARRVDESRRVAELARDLLRHTPVRRRIGWPLPSDGAVGACRH